jgi:hypothetical protein
LTILSNYLAQYALPPTVIPEEIDGGDGEGTATGSLSDKAGTSSGVLPLPVTSPRTRAKFSMSKFESRTGQIKLLPARLPPAYSVFDVFPFSLLVRFLTKRGKQLKGKKAKRYRARMGEGLVEGNVPLEITLYLVNVPPLFPSESVN